MPPDNKPDSTNEQASKSQILEFLQEEEGGGNLPALSTQWFQSAHTEKDSKRVQSFQRPLSTIDCHRMSDSRSSLDSTWLDRLKELFNPKAPAELKDDGPLPKLVIGGKEENYPRSKQLDIVDSYGESNIADPYQWLEKNNSPEAKSWLEKQTALTRKYLDSIPDREGLYKRLEQIYNYETRSDMFKHAGKYYLWKQDGLKEQPELCVLDEFHGKPKTILDPNKLSKEGHGIVRDLRLSESGRYAVFRFADGGQDATQPKVYDLQEQKEIKELPESEKVSQTKKDLRIEMPDGSQRHYFVMSKNADKNKLVYKENKTEKEKEVLPETRDQLLDAQLVGGKILAHYLHDGASKLKLFDLEGKHLRDIELPARGTVKSINGSSAEKEVLFTFSTFTTPNTIYRYDLESGKLEAHFKAKPPFKPEDFITEEKFCKSKDGTPVHLFIVHKKGLELNGQNPTYLHGYGGFRINRTPQFDNGNIAWLESGGVLAVANLRGGSEYGESWHKGGQGKNKQNVFDDFIASAEFLVKSKYSSASKLAIGGRSNGGLLVGATLVQRPELFAAAIPEVGLFDMLRFPKLGPGRAWEPEYGYPSNPDDFKNFLKYSPLHNLKRGQDLPAVLTMTNTNDDRVLPAHSFKFTAAAQRAQGDEKNPVLLYVGENRGHGPEKFTSAVIDEYASKWAFLRKAMGLSKSAGH